MGEEPGKILMQHLPHFIPRRCWLLKIAHPSGFSLFVLSSILLSLALVPVLLGLLLLCRLWPRMNWLSRWPTAFAIGATAGYNIVRYIRTDLLNQIEATIQPGLIAVRDGGLDIGATVSQVLVLVGTVCGLAYFYYSREHRGFFGRLARVGVLFMMISFGASFGYTVMGRISVLVGRFNLLLSDWLGIL